jgi:conjugative relaxase-like TrwC/TraI family protein
MMTFEKLTAGDGYVFLVRQTAAHNAEKRGHATLDDASENGEPPGQWLGRGLSALSQPISRTLVNDVDKSMWRIEAGSPVSDDQMKALFLLGLHPNTDKIVKHLISHGIGKAAAKSTVRLGRPIRVNDASTELRRRLAAAYRDHNLNQGEHWNAPVDDQLRAQIQTTIARKVFTELHGREPADDHDLSKFIARGSHESTTSVACYHLTFTPVKSVSVLWALAPLEVAHKIEQCHNRAVADAFKYLDDHTAFSRMGAQGVAQIATEGFIAAQFSYHASRADDPNLCTHIAVSNKVRAVAADGIPRWLALDGRYLHKATVAASELYNTRIEAYLIDVLGLSFAERAGTEPGKRPVREIAGVPADLCKLLSSRRGAIKPRYDELAKHFQLEYSREPTTSESFALSRRAALETREARHEPRSPAQQRAHWRDQATEQLGGQAKLNAMLEDALTARHPPPPPITPEWIQAQAAAVIETVAKSRSAWQRTHVFAEAQRRVRAGGVAADPQIAVALTDAALQEPHSVAQDRDNDTNLGQPHTFWQLFSRSPASTTPPPC